MICRWQNARKNLRDGASLVVRPHNINRVMQRRHYGLRDEERLRLKVLTSMWLAP